MRALSLTQPWASLVAIGAKRIETRSWPTSFRGAIAIHAAKGMPASAGDFARSEPAYAALHNAGVVPFTWLADDELRQTLPRGAVIAVCRLERCVPTDMLRMDIRVGFGWWTPDEAAFGDYTPGRWAWLLADVQRLPEPIPARGSLGLWQWTPPEDFPYATERACRVCGCTDDRACPGGCWWVDADLCSACRQPALAGVTP